MASGNGSGQPTGLIHLFDAEWGPWVLTVGAGVASALFFSLRQRWAGPAAPLPGSLQLAGSVTLDEGDVGGEAEVLRDFSRALAAGGIHVMHLPGAPRVVPPPSGVNAPASVGSAAGLPACESAFAEALAAGRAGPVPEAAVKRLIGMLSVGPAVSLLLRVGCPPSLQSHRFVVVCGGRTARVLTVGFLPDPQTGKPRHLLTISSPDLLADAPAGGATHGREGTVLAYEVRPVALNADIEREVAKEVPRWAAKYTDVYA